MWKRQDTKQWGKRGGKWNGLTRKEKEGKPNTEREELIQGRSEEEKEERKANIEGKLREETKEEKEKNKAKRKERKKKGKIKCVCRKYRKNKRM